ncbi:MAG: hypothetical protein QM610_09790 [Chitinophagaceae bacterium]
MSIPRLFHISEDPDIAVFHPRPSPSYFETIKGDAVFAVSERLLHNYMLPRDCPRVTFYSGADTTENDRHDFLDRETADFVVAVENKWYSKIVGAVLYCYEFPTETFELLDETAGYYVSYKSVRPIVKMTVKDSIGFLLSRNIALRFQPSLKSLAKDVARSTLRFSLIRMRNAVE